MRWRSGGGAHRLGRAGGSMNVVKYGRAATHRQCTGYSSCPGLIVSLSSVSS